MQSEAEIHSVGRGRCIAFLRPPNLHLTMEVLNSRQCHSVACLSTETQLAVVFKGLCLDLNWQGELGVASIEFIPIYWQAFIDIYIWNKNCPVPKAFISSSLEYPVSYYSHLYISIEPAVVFLSMLGGNRPCSSHACSSSHAMGTCSCVPVGLPSHPHPVNPLQAHLHISMHICRAWGWGELL